MNFQIAIPSYKRSQKLNEKTLAYLRTLPVEWDKITVFLNSEEELADYKKDISGVRFAVVGGSGIATARTFIRSYYPENTNVLNLDDDIKTIRFLNPDVKPIPLFNRMFELLREQNCSLWGIYPTNTTNMYYNKDRVAIGFQYILGACFGWINKPLQYPEYLNYTLDDRWLSMYCYKQDGKVLRYEGCSAYTNNYSKGGLEEVRKNYRDRWVAAGQTLEAQYPDLCKYQVKKNGKPDVVFKRMNRVFIPLYNTQQETTTQQESRCEADSD